MNNCVIICCRTLEKEVLAIVEETGYPYPVFFLPLGLHGDPNKLREHIQNLIDSLGNVEKVLLCVSGCGGGTKGLKATTADLVIPKTADCIDILLSRSAADAIHRDPNGVFMTQSWIDASRNAVLDFAYMVQTRGKEQATSAAQRLYAGYEHFYIINTGTYDVKAVQEFLAPLIEAINGTIDVIPGGYQVLRDLLSGSWNESFQVVPKGQISK